MAIQWFPGHMHLTKKAITERIKDIDVVIEVLDARLPGSSANPLLAEITDHKPKLKVLNKQDVADPERTALWVDWYNAQSATRAVGLDASDPAPARKLIDACHLLAPNRGGMAKPMRVLICGVPNVGKSTLINTLTSKRQAKTGDEAGITKLEQRITLADDFYLWDTPGMLWPRIIVPESGYNLAASGAVGRNAYDEELVALELLRRLQEHYAPLLEARYKLGLPPGARGHPGRHQQPAPAGPALRRAQLCCRRGASDQPAAGGLSPSLCPGALRPRPHRPRRPGVHVTARAPARVRLCDAGRRRKPCRRPRDPRRSPRRLDRQPRALRKPDVARLHRVRPGLRARPRQVPALLGAAPCTADPPWCVGCADQDCDGADAVRHGQLRPP